MAEDDVEIEKIAEHGDVVLRIGSPIEGKLLVSADVLKRTSKVFAALLGPHFREGQSMGTATSPHEIDLPEDRAEAMPDMCNLLHFNTVEEFSSSVPLTSDRIFALAVAIDKYGSSESLHLQTQALLLSWINHNSNPEPRISDVCTIAAASFLLGQGRCFKMITNVVIRHSTSADMRYFMAHPGDILPQNAILTIERKRNVVFNQIAANLPQLGMPRCPFVHPEHSADPHPINYDAKYMASICKGFDVEYWPPNFSSSPVTIETTLANIKKLDLRRSVLTCRHTSPLPDAKQEVMNFIDGLGKYYAGICLACLNRGETSLLVECVDPKH